MTDVKFLLTAFIPYIIPVKGSGSQEGGSGRGQGGGVQEGAIWPSAPPFYRYAVQYKGFLVQRSKSH